jgi:xanthine dehydrogenase YagT iron-sulfur-binding subunit
MGKPTVDKERRDTLSRRRFFNSVAVGATEAAMLTVPGPATAQLAPPAPADAESVAIVLNVNGRTHSLRVEPRWTLLQVLRERLGLTGTKPGCERGECGACTVLIDGVARYSCLTLAVEAAGAQITTLEGLLRGEELGPVQRAFLEEDAYQCGCCTPGQIMNIEGLLRKTPEPTLEQIREGVCGNLCRCGAYANIFRAAERASQLKKAGR